MEIGTSNLEISKILVKYSLCTSPIVKIIGGGGGEVS